MFIFIFGATDQSLNCDQGTHPARIHRLAQISHRLSRVKRHPQCVLDEKGTLKLMNPSLCSSQRGGTWAKQNHAT